MKLINLEKVNLPKTVIESLPNFLEKYYSIKSVILYGSRATKKNKQNSDVDIAIICDNDKDRINIKIDIEDLRTLYSFDIVFLDDNLSDLLKDEIRRNGVVIWKRN